jgi:PAS domain S-box-containing protein
VLRPVEQLISGLRHVEAGNYVQALNRTPTPLRELDELQRSLGSLAMALEAQRFERDQALAALSEREARYRELFKANPQVMFVYEIRSLRFLAVNEAALAFYGYSREEMLDMALPDVEPPGIQVPQYPSPDGGVPGHAPTASGPRSHQKKNGDIRLVERIASPTVFEGWPAELMMVTDVTERLATEARVREGAERLEQRVAERTRELQLSIRELEAFSYSVSHDLRNPLGAVGMFGQMLAAHLGDSADEQARLYLARIEQGVRGMESLIDDLLTLAQVARAQLVMAPVDLTALCREVIEGLRLADPQRKVEVSLEDGLQCTGDAGLLRQLLVNLLGNAWKFTARTPKARIRIGREPEATGPAAAFFVEDNGAGFDMKFAGRLFLPFERLHGDHDFPGTGIGLATVQRIVARHGGRIWAEAVPEQGATFHVEIGSHLPD